MTLACTIVHLCRKAQMRVLYPSTAQYQVCFCAITCEVAPPVARLSWYAGVTCWECVEEMPHKFTGYRHMQHALPLEIPVVSRLMLGSCHWGKEVHSNPSQPWFGAGRPHWERREVRL